MNSKKEIEIGDTVSLVIPDKYIAKINFQLVSIQQSIQEYLSNKQQDSIVLFMSVNGKCANIAMNEGCFKNKEYARDSLIAAVNGLIDNCYGDE